MALPDTRLLIPAYIYPGSPPRTAWTPWFEAADVIGGMIADPASGPGTGDTNYSAVIPQAKSLGIRVWGYVDTNFGAVSAATVRTNIDLWFSLYGVRDIFFDNVTSGMAGFAYQQPLVDYVHTAGGLAMLNCGTNCDEGYARMGDVVCTFEGPQSSYAAYVPDGWVTKYPRSKFCHFVYNCPDSATMQGDILQAQIMHCGNLYIADTGSWFALPAFYADEVAALRTTGSPFADAVYSLLDPVAEHDADYGWPLLSYSLALAAMFDPVDTIVRDAPGVPGWGLALDANNVPAYALPWLGQFAGVAVDTAQDVPTQRAQILTHSGFRRGTLAAMIAAGQATMTGTKSLAVVERSGDAWTVAFTGTTAEIPSVPATLAALKSQKPAGVAVTLNGSGGASPSTTYAQVKGHGTYATVKALYANYLDMRTRGS